MPPAAPRATIDKDELVELIAARLSPQLATIQTSLLRLEDKVNATKTLVDKHEATIYGNGDREGITTKISHLVKSERAASWILGIIAGVAISSAVASFIYLVQSHPIP